MTLFMDMHQLDGPVSMEDVAKAHAADLATQDDHGVHYLRYWVDEGEGKIFCLVDAPDARPGGRRDPPGPRGRVRPDTMRG
jgi:hypothetical protein